MTETAADLKPRPRLDCLDALRGFVITGMLLVNMTWDSDAYRFHPQLNHIAYNAPEQGATFTDLVFPWFLFMAGCSIPLSMRSGRGRGMSDRAKIVTAIRRGGVIYLLGVLITVAGYAYGSPVTWKALFGWNILQLIGAGYACAVVAYLLPKKAQILLVFGVLAGKLLVLTLIPADVARTAMSDTGFDPRVAGSEYTGTGTFTHFDDIKRLLHLEHLKAEASANGSGFFATLLLYIGGWFGMAQQFLPCAAIAVMGGWCTEMLSDSKRAGRVNATRVALVGSAAIAIACLLQAGYRPAGGGWLGRFTVPFSKWLFSPSYCLLAAGTGAVLLAGFYAVTDLTKLTRLTGLRVMGVNALALYVSAELSFKVVFSKWQVIHPNGYNGAMAGGLIAWVSEGALGIGLPDESAKAVGAWSLAVVWITVWWLFSYALWRRNVIIKV